MNFMFSWQEQYLTSSLRSLLHKIHIFSIPCNIFYVWRLGDELEIDQSKGDSEIKNF